MPATAPPMHLSQRLKALEPSATLAMAAKAKELTASGATVYDFTLGEPDFTTPEHICQAAVAAMKSGHTHYTPAPGIPALRAAVAKDYQKRHGIAYAPTQVVISNGAKHALHNVFTALLDEGDEVIVPAPYWVSYAEIIKLAGATPVILQTKESDNFKLQPAEFAAAVNSKTRMLLLCSPSNPTGTTYTRDELGALADVVLEKNLVVVSDEIYEHLVYDQEFASFPTVRPGLVERTILVNGVSKAYAMTGWRIGWTICPPAAAKAIADLQSQETSNPCSVSQYAALAALDGPQECVATMKAAFDERRKWVAARIAQLPNVPVPKMEGAFYAFINVQAHLGKTYGGKRIDKDLDFCLELLGQQQVATVMGSAFGAEGYARLSYATSIETLKAGFDRLEAFLRSAK